MISNLDISLDEVLVIGDDEVDKEMIRAAGMGVAMDDSPRAVKEAADQIAPSVEQHGFSSIIEELVL